MFSAFSPPHRVSNHATCLWVDVVRFYSFWCAIANRGHRLRQKYMECLLFRLSFIFTPTPRDLFWRSDVLVEPFGRRFSHESMLIGWRRFWHASCSLQCGKSCLILPACLQGTLLAVDVHKSDHKPFGLLEPFCRGPGLPVRPRRGLDGSMSGAGTVG